MSNLTIDVLKSVTPKKPEFIEDLGMLYPRHTSKQTARYGMYRCECGKEFKSMTRSVKSGATRSCGCYHIKKVKEANTGHGLANHPLFQTWYDMIKRCTNPSCAAYCNYGGRGITVCERWKTIENFVEDMYPTYIEGLSIDRVDNNSGYSKDNCRWSSSAVQSRNTRRLQVNNTSGYRGVSYSKQSKKWEVSIKINSKKTRIGFFNTSLEGAIAYDTYVVENNLEHTTNGLINKKGANNV